MNRTEVLNIFNKQYSDLSDMNCDRFAELANELLQTNYFVESKPNIDDFRFIVANAQLFSAYFSLINIDFGIDQTRHYAYITNKHSKLILNQFESQVLLAFRYLYQKKFSEVTLSDAVTIYYSDLEDELKRPGSIKDVKIDDIKPVLKKYRDYNIISYVASDITKNKEARISICPSILTAVQYDTMDEIVSKIDSYTKGGREDEEADENQAD